MHTNGLISSKNQEFYSSACDFATGYVWQSVGLLVCMSFSWLVSSLVVKLLFLVACTRLYNPLCPPVGWSVRRSHFTFFYDFVSLTLLLLPKWSGDLEYGPCPPARDFGSRVSGLGILTKALTKTDSPHISYIFKKGVSS